MTKVMANELTPMDLLWTGRPRSIAALLIQSAGKSALVDPGPQSTLETLRAEILKRGQNFQTLDALLLTHIHLDHAGATGSIIRENPNLKVYVHEVGAPHMVDPSRLLASAGRLYGETLPVPKENLKSLRGGERIQVGESQLDAFYTPGHASHHLTYWDRDSRTAFVGDTAGIRVQNEAFLLPATPPPDIDVDIWNQSLDTINSWKPERLFLTHFGFIEDPAHHIRRYKERLREWTLLTRKLLESGMETMEAEEAFVDEIASGIKSVLPSAAADHYIFNGGLRLSWLGLMRYVRKQAQLGAFESRRN